MFIYLGFSSKQGKKLTQKYQIIIFGILLVLSNQTHTSQVKTAWLEQIVGTSLWTSYT